MTDDDQDGPASREELAEEIDRINRNMTKLLEDRQEARRERDELADRVDELESAIIALQAVTAEQGSKVARFEAILEHAGRKPRGGRGATVTNGEAMAATGCTARTIRRYFRELDATFDWVTYETYPGRREGEIHVRLGEHSVANRVAQLHDRVAADGGGDNP